MKKVAIGAVLAIIIGTIGMFAFGGNVFSKGENENIDERKTVNSEQIKEMDINVDVGEVHITESKSDNIEVHFHGHAIDRVKKQIDFLVNQDETKLEVKVKQNNKFFTQIPFITSDLNSERILDIAIPKKVLEKLTVNVDVGEITIEDIDPKQMKAENNVGEIFVSKYNGNGLYKSDVGNIKLEKMNGKIKAQSDTGGIDINIIELTEDIDLKSDVGEIEVTIENDTENLAFDLSSEIGDVTVSGFDGYQNSTSKSIITKIGNEGPIIRAKTDIGGISVVSNQ
ncbi:DUF4097 family beta strand repeat-containing protein [Metabacillus malikii]|uniref:DUF4097 domain-containing protein n=1 Tax=Metabacillus malikii TaxID=1504265 RepID=A0ABT9ZG98_9BACI|nr:DUF4097 family beta strand repeat-containing protein [Metabacillus malikii]MDQ0230826.1 hypothetical protein [Metabacillus malikii]